MNPFRKQNELTRASFHLRGFPRRLAEQEGKRFRMLIQGKMSQFYQLTHQFFPSIAKNIERERLVIPKGILAKIPNRFEHIAVYLSYMATPFAFFFSKQDFVLKSVSCSASLHTEKTLDKSLPSKEPLLLLPQHRIILEFLGYLTLTEEEEASTGKLKEEWKRTDQAVLSMDRQIQLILRLAQHTPLLLPNQGSKLIWRYALDWPYLLEAIWVIRERLLLWPELNTEEQFKLAEAFWAVETLLNYQEYTPGTLAYSWNLPLDLLQPFYTFYLEQLDVPEGLMERNSPAYEPPEEKPFEPSFFAGISDGLFNGFGMEFLNLLPLRFNHALSTLVWNEETEEGLKSNAFFQLGIDPLDIRMGTFSHTEELSMQIGDSQDHLPTWILYLIRRRILKRFLTHLNEEFQQDVPRRLKEYLITSLEKTLKSFQDHNLPPSLESSFSALTALATDSSAGDTLFERLHDYPDVQKVLIWFKHWTTALETFKLALNSPDHVAESDLTRLENVADHLHVFGQGIFSLMLNRFSSEEDPRTALMTHLHEIKKILSPDQTALMEVIQTLQQSVHHLTGTHLKEAIQHSFDLLPQASLALEETRFATETIALRRTEALSTALTTLKDQLSAFPIPPRPILPDANKSSSGSSKAKVLEELLNKKETQLREQEKSIQSLRLKNAELQKEVEDKRALKEAMRSAEVKGIGSLNELAKGLLMTLYHPAPTEVARLAEQFLKAFPTHKLVLLDSAIESADSYNRNEFSAEQLLETLLRLCFEYLPHFLKSGDNQARHVFGDRYSAQESDTVMNSKEMVRERTFLYKNKNHLFIKHLSVGRFLRIYFDIIDKSVVVAYIGHHLTCSMTD